MSLNYLRPKLFVGDVFSWEAPTGSNKTFYMICEIRYKSGRRYRIRPVSDGSWHSKWLTYTDIADIYKKTSKLPRLLYG